MRELAVIGDTGGAELRAAKPRGRPGSFASVARAHPGCRSWFSNTAPPVGPWIPALA